MLKSKTLTLDPANDDQMREFFRKARKLDKANYTAPAEISSDPGLLLKFVYAVNHPDRTTQALQRAFGISRQSAWLWCRSGWACRARRGRVSNNW